MYDDEEEEAAPVEDDGVEEDWDAGLVPGVRMP